MPSSPIRRAPACVPQAALFQDPLLEEPPLPNAAPDLRRRSADLAREAADVCGSCPLWVSCLYEAVVRHDVAGYVAGTTQRERTRIRSRLGVVVAAEDFDTLAGVVGGHRQVDHDQVVRLNHANPHESLETLARRLGCSLSTVKRHLRAERNGTRPPQPRHSVPEPAAVLEAYARVTGGRPAERSAAA